MGEFIPVIIGMIKPVKDLISEAIEETKYFNVYPEEYLKEVKLAKERKKNGDTFHPSYDEYLDILAQAKKQNRMLIIKWERHFSDSQWTAHIQD